MSLGFAMIWKDCLKRFRSHYDVQMTCAGAGDSDPNIKGLKFKRTNTELVRGVRQFRQQLPQTPTDMNQSISKGGPFRATQLWNEIIHYLKTEVQVKRRRLKIFQYDECFTGGDAVDCVLNRLQEERFNFTRDVSREKAVKLCQLLMENQVFESVSNSSSDNFDDSQSKLYRFLDDSKENVEDTSTCSDFTAVAKEDSMRIQRDLDPEMLATSDGGYINPVAINKHGQIVQELMDITGAWKRYSSECLRKLTPAKLFTRRASLGSATPSTAKSSRARSKKNLPPAVEDEIWREAVLSRLLLMVDLPVLDSILSYDPTRHERPQQQDMAFSNLAFRRHESFNQTLEKREEDVWLESAIDCLECLPQGHDLLDQSLSEDTSVTQKLRLYQSLCDHYGKLSKPMWSSEFSDLHIALFNLLMQGKRSSVLRALQLSMVLLPRTMREEMKRLLIFMKLAAEDDAVGLSSKESNREHVEKSFRCALIQSGTLTPHQTGQLVLFMMDHVEEVFSVPEEVEEDIGGHLQQLVKGQSLPVLSNGLLPDGTKPLPEPTLTYHTTFCKRVTVQEFKKQKLEGTELALVELMNNILDDTNISLKEKKQRFKQFQKHHPDIYKSHFSEIQ